MKSNHGVPIVTLCVALVACSSGTSSAADDVCGIGTAPLPGVTPHTDTRLSLAGSPFAVAVSSQDVAYISQLSGTVTEVQLPTLAFAHTIPVGREPTDIAFNANGSEAYVTNQASQNVGVIDVGSHTQAETIAMHGDPFSIFVRPGVAVVYVVTNRDTLFAIDGPSGIVMPQVPMGGSSVGMAACHGLLYISTRDAGIVTEMDMNTTTVRRTFAVGGQPEGIVISPTGAELYIANLHFGTVQVWDVASNVSRGDIAVTGPAFWLAQSPGNGLLYVTTFTGGQVQVVDPSTRMKIDSFVVGGIVRHIAFNAAGTIAVVANENGWVDFLH